MIYRDFKTAAERHQKTCVVIKQYIEELQQTPQNKQDTIQSLTMNLYYIAGYIFECSLKYMILEGDEGVSTNADCEAFLKEQKLLHHNLQRLDLKYTKSLPNNISCLGENTGHSTPDDLIKKLFQEWDPKITRYENQDVTFEQVCGFLRQGEIFLRKTKQSRQ